MSTLSTTAWIAHDLGLAAAFGGSLFGKFALGNAVKQIPSPEDRGRVLYAAWNGYNILNAISFGVAAVTWLVGRTFLSGDFVGKDVRALVIAKDTLLGATVATGAGAMICGRLLGEERSEGAIPVVEGGEPAPEASPREKGLLRATSILGGINLACTAGVLGITAILAMKSGKSSKWSFISRFLP